MSKEMMAGDNDILQCIKCRKFCVRIEARLRVFNTNSCAYCNGELVLVFPKEREEYFNRPKWMVKMKTIWLALLLSVQVAWAGGFVTETHEREAMVTGENPSLKKLVEEDQKREAAEREQRSKSYKKPFMFTVNDFMVINSTEIYEGRCKESHA